MPETDVIDVDLPPGGESLLLPPIRDVHSNEYRVTLEGMFRLRDMPFDARYIFGSDGSVIRRHDYLTWLPIAPALETEDRSAHRYTFRIPSSPSLEGISVSAMLNVDRLVDETLEPPSQIRAELTGGIRVTFTEIYPSPWPAWLGLTAAGAPAAIAAAGIGWVIRRRIAFHGLDADLVEAVARIDRKYRAALASAARSPHGGAGLRARLMELGAGAYALARQTQELRNAREAATRAPSATRLLRKRHLDPAVTQTLAEDRAARDLAGAAVDRAEARCLVRLARTESALEAAVLTLRGRAGDRTAPAEEDLLRELASEVAAIREVETQLISTL